MCMGYYARSLRRWWEYKICVASIIRPLNLRIIASLGAFIKKTSPTQTGSGPLSGRISFTPFRLSKFCIWQGQRAIGPSAADVNKIWIEIQLSLIKVVLIIFLRDGDVIWQASFYENSLWFSDAISRHRSGSTSAQVMACCLTAPSHYLNQCWLIINEARWHLAEVKKTALDITHNKVFEK